MFGGISVILTGDPAQLLPVLASPLYDYKSKSTLAINGYYCYNNSNVVIKLTKIVRQQNVNNCPKQNHFIEWLNRLRNGESTIKDWKLLSERVVSPENIKSFIDATYLSDLNESVDKYNKEKLEKLNSPTTKLSAVNSKNTLKTVDADVFSGLNNSIYVN